MKYIVVDASLHGTGIRDYYEGGYIEPETLNLDDKLIEKLNNWLLKYENEHYDGFLNEMYIEELDKEGKDIARIIKRYLREVKVDYYSDARMRRESIDD